MATVMDALSIGMNAVGASSVYKEEREKGGGVARAVGSAAADFLFYEMMGPAAVGLFAVQGAKMGLEVAHQFGHQNAQISSRAHRANFGGSYYDNQQSATMRQRGLQAMYQSNLQGYSTLGNEARRYYK